MSKSITVDFTADISKFAAAMAEAARTMSGRYRQITSGGRAANREIRQMQRNMLTGPVSDERREIQAIGRREMAAAIAEFKARNGVVR